MSNEHSQKTLPPHRQEHSSQKMVRPRNAEETRAALLAAARVRFARDGYEATNLRDIASDVGVNVALIPRYFGSKELSMKNYMIVKQRVADFAQFQSVFDQLLPNRQQYGLTDIGTFRAADEPNTVIVIMEVADLARAKEYWHSDILAAGRKKAGVVGPLAADTDQVWLTDGSVLPIPDVYGRRIKQS